MKKTHPQQSRMDRSKGARKGTRTRFKPKTYSPAFSRAEVSVFCSNMAIVIGPTPPGTGVIADATSFAASKSTSPTNLSLTRFFEANRQFLADAAVALWRLDRDIAFSRQEFRVHVGRVKFGRATKSAAS